MSPSSHKAWRDVLQALEHEETLKTLGRAKTRAQKPTQASPLPTETLQDYKTHACGTFDAILEELEGTHGLEAIEKQHETQPPLQADFRRTRMQARMQNLGASKFHQAMTRGLGQNGRDFVQRVAIAGGLTRHYPALAPGLLPGLLSNFAAARVLEIYGSPEQHERYLRPLRTGAFVCQFAGPTGGQASGEKRHPESNPQSNDRSLGPLYLALVCEKPASSGDASGLPRLLFFPTKRPPSSAAWQLVGQDVGRSRAAAQFLSGVHAVTRLIRVLALAERLYHGLQQRLQRPPTEAETARDASSSEATTLLEDDLMAVHTRMEALRMGLAMTALHQEIGFHHPDPEWRAYSRRVGALLYAVASRWARHEAGVFFQIGCTWGLHDDELTGLVDILRNPWTGSGHSPIETHPEAGLPHSPFPGGAPETRHAMHEIERPGVNEKQDLDLYLERMHVLVNRMNQHGGKAMALVRARLAHAIDTLDASSHALWAEEGEPASETKNSLHPEHAPGFNSRPSPEPSPPLGPELRPRQDACRRALLTHQFGIVLGAEMLARLFVYHHARHEADQNSASETNQDKKKTKLFWTRMACYYATRNLPDATSLALQGGGADIENAGLFSDSF